MTLLQASGVAARTTKIGILPVVDRAAGGTYQYSATMLDAVIGLRDRIEPVIVNDRPELLTLSDEHVPCELLPFSPPTLRRAARATLARAIGDSAITRATDAFRRSLAMVSIGGATGEHGSSPLLRNGAWLRAHGIDLMLYPSPTTVSFECGVPYVMAVHDLQHRIQPEFPEVSENGEWEAREYLFSNGIANAEAILVDSDVGREDVLGYYGHLTSPDRVHVLPFVPPPYLVKALPSKVAAVVATHRLPARYLLFPAQLWPHKNHQRVVQAVAYLHRQGVDVTVVLTGSAHGPIRSAVLAEITQIVKEHSIEHLVRVLGYVDDETISSLYVGASGVILPTFFGPTNIPVIEAWAMGVPVLTSDIRGIREQCGDAALLVDPTSTEAIGEGMRRLWEDESLRARLVAAGAARLPDDGLGAFADGLATVLDDVLTSMHAGRPPTTST